MGSTVSVENLRRPMEPTEGSDLSTLFAPNKTFVGPSTSQRKTKYGMCT